MNIIKSMPYKLKQKIRQYNKAIIKANEIHDELVREFESYGVPYDNLVANGDYTQPQTEVFACINNAEGAIEENITEIENIFIYFTNLKD